MSLASFVPGLGERTARERLRLVYQDTLAVDVLLSLAFAKAVEYTFARFWPSVGGQHLAWLAFTGVLVVLVVYEDHRQRAAEAAKDAAEEAAEAAAEAVDDQGGENDE